jgi:hypothetical protein
MRILIVSSASKCVSVAFALLYKTHFHFLNIISLLPSLTGLNYFVKQGILTIRQIKIETAYGKY